MLLFFISELTCVKYIFFIYVHQAFFLVQGYLNNLFALLAGSSIVFLVGAIAQLCWPQSLKDKRLATVSSCVSSSQSYCSDIHSLDSSEVCFLVLEMLLLAQGESCLFLSVETLWYFILFSGFFFT